MSLTEYSKTYKPFKYAQFVQRSVESAKMAWHEEEADLKEDVNQWKRGEITETEKYHITSILKMFTQADSIVGGSYVDYFLPVFKNNEARMALLGIAERECTHQRAYALLNDTLGFDESIYSEFLQVKEMHEKADFMLSGFGKDSLTDTAISLAQTVCNEGVSLYSSFAMLLNYQRFGKMKGMCEIVEWSLKDEAHHAETITMLFRQFCTEHPRIVTDEMKKAIYVMFTRAVELEDKIIDLAYSKGEIKGLTSKEIKEYIRYIANRRLVGLGLKEIFPEVQNNPLTWLDWVVNGASHKNFFEGRVTDYSVAGMKGDWGW